MHKPRTVRALRLLPFAVLAAVAGLSLASALGAPVPSGWAPSVGDILFLATLFLLFQVNTWGHQRLAADAVEQLQALAEEKARLKAEADRAAREAEQARERLEAEVRSLRLACQELRREQLARPPAQVG